MDVIALIISVGAFIVSGISVWYTRREAHAAEGALSIERKREYERNRPPVVPRFDEWLSEPMVALLELENRGGRAIDRVLLKTLSGDPKLVGFAQDESQIRLRERDFGRLEPGLPLTAEFVVVDPAALDEPRVKFFATYSIADDTWNELLDVELPKRGPWAVRA